MRILVALMAVMVMLAGCHCSEKKACCGSEKCAEKKAAVAACKKCGDGPCKCKAAEVKKCTKCEGECKCEK